METTRPDDELVLTGPEILALLRLSPTSAAAASAEVFGLEQPDAARDTARLGLSSLVARGLVKVSADRFETVGATSQVARALTEATSWLSFAIQTPSFLLAGAACVVDGGVVAATLGPVSTFHFMAVAEPADTLAGSLVARAVRPLDASDDVAATVCWRHPDRTVTLNLRRARGTWRAAGSDSADVLELVGGPEDIADSVNRYAPYGA